MPEILFLSHYGTLYGANRSLLALLSELQAAGRFTPIVAVGNASPLTDQLDRLNVEWIETPLPWWARPLNDLAYEGTVGYLRYVKQTFHRNRNTRYCMNILRDKLKHRPIAIVHTNSLVLDAGFILSKLLGVPHVWHAREFLEDDYQLSIPGGVRTLKKRIRKSARVICISKTIQRFLSSPPNAIVIENGVAQRSVFEETFRNRISTSTNGQFRIGMLGKFTESKGQDVAIRLLSSMLDSDMPAKLFLGGDGPTHTALLNLARKLNVSEHVEFCGVVSNPLTFFSEMDVALMCSHKEGWGRVTAEAMGAGCTVLGRATGATPELIHHNKTGFLWTDEQQLLGQMKSLWEAPETLATTGRRAHATACHRFTNEGYYNAVEGVYDAIIDRSFTT